MLSGPLTGSATKSHLLNLWNSYPIRIWNDDCWWNSSTVCFLWILVWMMKGGELPGEKGNSKIKSFGTLTVMRCHFVHKHYTETSRYTHSLGELSQFMHRLIRCLSLKIAVCFNRFWPMSNDVSPGFSPNLDFTNLTIGWIYPSPSPLQATQTTGSPTQIVRLLAVGQHSHLLCIS